MGLSTHVLDTMHGCPAAGMAVELYTTAGASPALVKRFALNDDGQEQGGMGVAVADYDEDGHFDIVKTNFAPGATTPLVPTRSPDCGVALPEPSFLGKVSLDFGVAQPDQHYHVPLLVSPWSYSTYRGS